METWSQIWTLLTLLSVFAIPQLLGVLLFYRLLRFSRWLAFILGTLAPPILFFFLITRFVSANFRAAEEPVSCGMLAFVLGLMILMGTAINLVGAFGVNLFLFRKTVK